MVALSAMTPDEIEAIRVAKAALGPMGEAIDRGNLIFLDAPDADPSWECWEWLFGFIRMAYALIKRNRLTKLRILFTFDTIERR